VWDALIQPQKGGVVLKITVKRVEAIKATRIHLDPDAGGA